MQSSKQILNPIATIIQKKLLEKFKPTQLEVINESYMHSVPKGSETHFKVVVISDSFKNMSILNKHKSVQECLEWELKHGVHALSIVAKTPDEWSKSNKIPESPPCLGGSKKEKTNLEEKS